MIPYNLPSNPLKAVKSIVAPVTEGFGADIVIYDLDELDYGPMERLQDFPADDWRLVQRPKGYKYIIVNGVVTFTDDSQCTCETPGRFLRNGIASAPPVKIAKVHKKDVA